MNPEQSECSGIYYHMAPLNLTNHPIKLQGKNKVTILSTCMLDQDLNTVEDRIAEITKYLQNKMVAIRIWRQNIGFNSQMNRKK